MSYAIGVMKKYPRPEGYAISAPGAWIWSSLEEYANSVFCAISVQCPESYAICVPGAWKQKLGLKSYAISVFHAISVNAPESHAISVAGA